MSMLAASSAARTISAVAREKAHPDQVLIIAEEKETCAVLRDYLRDKGFKVATAGTGARAQEIWRAARIDVAILDYSLPDGNALWLIPVLKAIDASIPIILLTGYGSLDFAVKAVKLGAEHFLPKPAELSTLHVMIQRSLENQRNHRQQLVEMARNRSEVAGPFLGRSDTIRRLADSAQRAALNEDPVLIEGEVGTGKGTIARWLHRNGPRAGEPFTHLNCGRLSGDLLENELFGDGRSGLSGLPRKAGLLDMLQKGTIFLEEIEKVDIRNQTNLLKVLQEKQFRRQGEDRDRRLDIRLIAAIQQSPVPAGLGKQFQGDLYDRVPWVHVSVPPLRERVEDIPILSAHILRELTADLGTGPLELGGATLRALQGYSWPGNVRELRNVLERVALVAGNAALIDEEQQPDVQVEQYLTGFGQFRTLEEMERNYIQQVLHKERGRVQSAARKLGIPRSSLYHKLKQYKTDPCGSPPVS